MRADVGYSEVGQKRASRKLTGLEARSTASCLALAENSSISDCLARTQCLLTVSGLGSTTLIRISFGLRIAGHSPFSRS
jgi:hypothetical protein